MKSSKINLQVVEQVEEWIKVSYCLVFLPELWFWQFQSKSMQKQIPELFGRVKTCLILFKDCCYKHFKWKLVQNWKWCIIIFLKAWFLKRLNHVYPRQYIHIRQYPSFQNSLQTNRKQLIFCTTLENFRKF